MGVLELLFLVSTSPPTTGRLKTLKKTIFFFVFKAFINSYGVAYFKYRQCNMLLHKLCGTHWLEQKALLLHRTKV